MSIDALFYPRGVAVVGSTAAGKIGYELVKQLVEGGFTRVAAINPKAQGACGAPGYRALAETPEPVDLAIIAAPAPAVAGVLAECGEAGVRAVVIITAGFSEVGNRAGEEELRRIGRSYGMRLVGPNCAGIVNTGHNLYPTLETRPPRGPVAFISQSGALGGAVLSWAEEQGVGFSKFVSFGNRVDLDEISLLPYLAEDPETTVAALYIESVSDGRAFMEAVRDFCRRKPLVVIKSGRGQAGQRATLSHTGSLAGADAVYDAALHECGALRVAGIEEMFDLCRGFVSLPRPRGRRVVIVTNSGGPAVLAADRAEELGLQVAEPGPEVRQRLRTFLPSHCAFKNPIDLTVEGTETGYRQTLAAVLEEYDAALALNVAPPYLDSLPLARGICAASQASGVPVLANFMAGRVVAGAVAYLRERGIPNFATGERAMAVLARMADYAAWRAAQDASPAADAACPDGIARERRPVDPSASPAEGVEGQPVDPSASREPGEGRPVAHGSEGASLAIPPGQATPSVAPSPLPSSLLEPEAMAWLAANHLPVPPYRWAQDAAAALRGCAEIGYPVAMKVVSPDILHKSEFGGVRLNIGDAAAARAAFAALHDCAESAGAAFRGVVIYPMARDALEAIVGLSHDPQFGPVILFGLGGIFTEVLHDVAVRVAPLDPPGAMAMIHAIRGYPLLAGARGQSPRNLQALAGLLVRVSALPFRYPEIGELDLNPVFVSPHAAVIGDVRVIGRTTYAEVSREV